MNDAAPWALTSGTRRSIRFGGIELRQFALGPDTDDLYAIRSHESVRTFMTDPRPLDYTSHVNWVEAHLVPGGDVLLFLIRVDQQPIGLALLRQIDHETVEIGVMLRQAHLHGAVAGQVAAVMLHLTFEHFGFSFSLTYADQTHVRALALNRGLGLVESPSSKPGEICFRTPSAAVLINPRYRKLMTRLLPRLHITVFEQPG